MWRNGCVALVAAMLTSGAALAQNGRITGTITSIGDDRPVAGAQIQVVGTTLGALSGDDGRYSILAPAGTYRLRVLRIGFAADSAADVVVSSGGVTERNFQLRATAAVLTGTVVIGYGEQQAQRTTGSVGVVTSEQFAQGRVVSPQEAIQGKVAGVQVVDNNEPGGGLSIRVRGTASINASSEPLYVVDGVPLQTSGGISTDPKRNPLNFINPQDIESITVLKDASSAAIYGSRASNGVVLITTKHGRGQGTQVEFTSTASSSQVVDRADMLNAAQFRQAVTDHAPASRLALLGTANTDWRAAIERTGVGREQQLAVSGNREDMHYRLSLGYLDQGGVVLGTQVRRASTAMSYTDRLFNHLDVSANLKGSRSDDRFTPGSVIGNANSFGPTQPIYTSTGAFYYWSRGDTLIPQAAGNPVASLALVDDYGTTYRSVGNLETRYRVPFLEGLTAIVNVGYDLAASRHTIFTPSFEYSQISTANHGNFQRYNPSQINSLLDTYGNYVRDLTMFGGSNIDLTGGYSYESSRADYPSIIADSLGSDLLGTSGVPTAGRYTPGLRVDDSRLIAFFGRATYSIRDRYITTLSLRRDGSSKFGVNNQWGTFPAAAFAWRMTDEPFMQRFDKLNDLKLRLSWGVTGNQQFDSYQAISSYTYGDRGATAQFGNQFIPTIRPSGVDPNLKWEQTTSYDIGLDYGILQNRLAGTFDYYYKKTNDLLFRVPVPSGTNLSDFVMRNVGDMENRGFELGLSAQVITGGFRGLSWSANFNAAHNSNKLLSMNSSRIDVGGIGGAVGNYIQVLEPGLPVNTFLVYKHKVGPDGKPVATGTLADMYEDTNGDNVVNDADRRPFHNPAPKWILGHTSNLTLGNFDASFSLRAYLGNYTYNNVASNLGNYAVLSNGAAPTNLHASVLKYGFETAQYWSDVYIEDASFLRMDNITVGYTFNNFPSVRGVRVFGTIQNAFTITGYSGVDPTAGINGIDNNLYPRARTFLGGASVQF